FFQLQDFAADVDRDLARQVTAGNSCRDFGDVTHLTSQVTGHEVHVVGEIFPGSGDTWDLCLTTKLAFRSNFAGHARHFARERVQLVHHRVDGVFQLENFALNVDGNLSRQVAASHSGRDFSDVSDLGREVSGHGVDGVRQIFPGSCDTRYNGLAAEFSVGTDLASHTRHFRSERAQLVHHRVDGFFQLQNFTADVDRNLS